MLIAIPTGVKIFNWIFTMWGGSIRFTTAMKFAIALVALFTIGGISGVMHASPPADLQQTDTYFIVAHFHYVLFGGSMMGIFGRHLLLLPEDHRPADEREARQLALLARRSSAMNLTFFPMHFSGMLRHAAPHLHVRRRSGLGHLQPDEHVRRVSSQLVARLIFVYNFFAQPQAAARSPATIRGVRRRSSGRSRRRRPSTTSPRSRRVTSRYPLWDVKSPELTAEVPHSRHDDERNDVALAGKKVGEFHDHMSAGTPEDG